MYEIYYNNSLKVGGAVPDAPGSGSGWKKSPKTSQWKYNMTHSNNNTVNGPKGRMWKAIQISFRPGPTCPPEHTGSQAESCLRPQWISWTQVGSSCRWRTEKELQHHRLDSDPQVGSRFGPGEIKSNKTFFSTEVVAPKFPFSKS